LRLQILIDGVDRLPVAHLRVGIHQDRADTTADALQGSVPRGLELSGRNDAKRFNCGNRRWVRLVSALGL
jgi:hypothetical protein